VSIATAYFTRMSEHAHADDLGRVRDDVSSAIRGISLLVMLAAAAIIVLAYPFAAVFQPGHLENLAGLGNVIIAFGVGLVGFSILFVVQRAFYALGDTKTPFFFTLVQVVVFSAGALLALTLPLDWTAVGVAASTTVAGSIQLVIAAVLLRRRLGGLDGRRILVSVGRSLAALVLPVVAGVLLLLALGGTTEGGFAIQDRASAILSMAVIGIVMAALYFAGLWALRSPELRGFTEPLVRRLRRR
jgi:putative peptidoglycan lipid II flippase